MVLGLELMPHISRDSESYIAFLSKDVESGTSLTMDSRDFGSTKSHSSLSFRPLFIFSTLL
jgi:hypothetical protein